MEDVLVNGRAYDFAQIILKVGGVEIASISEVTYDEEQKKEFNMGRGNRPVSFGQAGIKAKGSITMSMNDVEALRDVAPNGSLLQVPFFDVTITFLNNQKVVTHVLKNAQFMNDGVDAKLDDTDIKKKFDLAISNIKYR